MNTVKTLDGLEVVSLMDEDEIQSAAYLLMIIRRRDYELMDESMETKQWLRLSDECLEWKASLNKIYERVYLESGINQ